MTQILSIALIAAMMILTGCDNGTTIKTQPPVPVQPVPEPTPTEPDEPEQPTLPTAGKGSIKADLDCNGGVITTTYSFGNVPNDNKNFVIEYQRNNQVEDLTYPSSSTTGSRTIVKDVYYAGPNDEKSPVYWIVTIVYQTAGETYDLVTVNLKQPACDDNATALNTKYEVY